jgi:hypothetical protein
VSEWCGGLWVGGVGVGCVEWVLTLLLGCCETTSLAGMHGGGLLLMRTDLWKSVVEFFIDEF